MVIVIIMVVLLCGVIPIIAAILQAKYPIKEDTQNKPITIDSVHHAEIQQTYKE